MEDINIYDDVSHVDLGSEIVKLEEQNKQLLDHIRKLEGDIKKLCVELTNMKELQHNLSRNISELYKTARLEIQRKDRRIFELQQEIDNLKLKQGDNPRKSKRQFWNRESDQSPKRFKNNPNDETVHLERKANSLARLISDDNKIETHEMENGNMLTSNKDYNIEELNQNSRYPSPTYGGRHRNRRRNRTKRFGRYRRSRSSERFRRSRSSDRFKSSISRNKYGRGNSQDNYGRSKSRGREFRNDESRNDYNKSNYKNKDQTPNRDPQDPRAESFDEKYSSNNDKEYNAVLDLTGDGLEDGEITGESDTLVIEENTDKYPNKKDAKPISIEEYRNRRKTPETGYAIIENSADRKKNLGTKFRIDNCKEESIKSSKNFYVNSEGYRSRKTPEAGYAVVEDGTDPRKNLGGEIGIDNHRDAKSKFEYDPITSEESVISSTNLYNQSEGSRGSRKASEPGYTIVENNGDPRKRLGSGIRIEDHKDTKHNFYYDSIKTEESGKSNNNFSVKSEGHKSMRKAPNNGYDRVENGDPRKNLGNEIRDNHRDTKHYFNYDPIKTEEMINSNNNFCVKSEGFRSMRKAPDTGYGRVEDTADPRSNLKSEMRSDNYRDTKDTFDRNPMKTEEMVNSNNFCVKSEGFRSMRKAPDTGYGRVEDPRNNLESEIRSDNPRDTKNIFDRNPMKTEEMINSSNNFYVKCEGNVNGRRAPEPGYAVDEHSADTMKNLGTKFLQIDKHEDTKQHFGYHLIKNEPNLSTNERLDTKFEDCRTGREKSETAYARIETITDPRKKLGTNVVRIDNHTDTKKYIEYNLIKNEPNISSKFENSSIGREKSQTAYAKTENISDPRKNSGTNVFKIENHNDTKEFVEYDTIKYESNININESLHTKFEDCSTRSEISESAYARFADITDPRKHLGTNVRIDSHTDTKKFVEYNLIKNEKNISSNKGLYGNSEEYRSKEGRSETGYDITEDSIDTKKNLGIDAVKIDYHAEDNVIKNEKNISSSKNLHDKCEAPLLSNEISRTAETAKDISNTSGAETFEDDIPSSHIDKNISDNSLNDSTMVRLFGDNGNNSTSSNNSSFVSNNGNTSNLINNTQNSNSKLRRRRCVVIGLKEKV